MPHCKVQRLLVFLCTCLVQTTAWSGATEVQLPANLDQWDKHSFKGETEYQFTEIDGAPVIYAKSSGTASGLTKEIEIDLTKTPILHWRWQVKDTLSNVNEKIKSGDDYPARIYVVRKGGIMPWRTRAINYVWSSQNPVGSHWPNAYTSQSQMLALRTGKQMAGQWVKEQRNVLSDFKKLFGEDITHVDVVAIMTDTDDSGQQAEAYYGDIYFSSE